MRIALKEVLISTMKEETYKIILGRDTSAQQGRKLIVRRTKILNLP